MQSQRAASTNGRAPSAGERANARSELDRLRVTCRRQARAIDALGEVIAVLRKGAGASLSTRRRPPRRARSWQAGCVIDGRPRCWIGRGC